MQMTSMLAWQRWHGIVATATQAAFEVMANPSSSFSADGSHLENLDGASAATMYQRLDAPSHWAPRACTRSFSSGGTKRYVRGMVGRAAKGRILRYRPYCWTGPFPGSSAEPPGFGSVGALTLRLGARFCASVCPWSPRDFLGLRAAGAGAWTPGESALFGTVVSAGGVCVLTVRAGRGTCGSFSGVRRTSCQSGTEASFRKPERSGRRSISEAITAGSILRCWLVVVEGSHRNGPRVLDWVV